ncbi:DJ-1/PfpI family protein [Corynebacterium xerosis]|uniref:DJ-1/PfpI family protein n=1 Tax=Corynebacterium xerosis TaxID=1725 RepID=UPI003665D056
MGHRPRGHPGHRRPLLEEGKTVGAICGATLGLARTGLLDGRAHTSNRPELLQVEGYHGADHYVDDRVVVDGNLITAPATGYLEFAREILRATGLLSDAAAEAWHQMFHTGERSWEDKLARELEKQVSDTP